MNGEVLFDPDLTGMEDSAAKPAPLLGLLIPDDEDPGRFLWHDYSTLTPATTLDVEPGTTLQIQA